jgi:CBS domain-containing protein
MKNVPISTLMQRAVKIVSLDDTVQEVEAFLARERLAWAPVLGDRGEIVGVISVADLVRFHAQQGDPAMPAWRQCTYRPMSVTGATPIDEVARLMIERHLHHVVVTEGDRIVGIVSSLDLLRSLI